jgi:hypothetical protein
MLGAFVLYIITVLGMPLPEGMFEPQASLSIHGVDRMGRSLVMKSAPLVT